MCSLIADILGLVGSIVLAYPAIRFSNFLKHIKNVKEIAAAGDASEDEKRIGNKLAQIAAMHTSNWNRTDHYLLILGLALLIAAFGLKVICQFF